MDTETSVALSALKFISGESDHICRLCFASTENEEIFIQDCMTVQRSYVNETISFVDMFDNLGVKMEPLLPEVLCMDCANTIINGYLFQKLCQYSHEKWTKALELLQKSLDQTDLINPTTKTAYMMINTNDDIIFTSRKSYSTKSKVIMKLKNIMNRTKFAQKKKNKVMVCEECGEKFNSKILLNKHTKAHIKNGTNARIACPQCAKLFATKIQLDDHTERIHYPKTIPCTKCPKKFGTEKMLRRHEKLDHIAAICKQCFVQFPSKTVLRAHLDKHDVNKCAQCGKSFFNKITFKLHLKICGNTDSKQPKFFCDVCKKGYARKNSLRTHLKTDHGFGCVIPCPWCNKKFDAVSRLRLHVVKHTKERNFYCEHCGGKFVTQAALVYHVRLHTGERPFPCDLCKESFLSASRRMEHKRRKHFEPTKECNICQVKFTTNHQLKKHVQRHYNPQSKLFRLSLDPKFFESNPDTVVENFDS